MEFLIAGSSAMAAGFFTNPLEVIKTRMQLQGELEKAGKHVVHYRNTLHATIQIIKHDGVLNLQAGLVPALIVQLIMNGFRLGGFQTIDNLGVLRDKRNNLIFYRAAIAAGVSGVFGHILSNPFHIIRTHRQSMACKAIAVGEQHIHRPLHKHFLEIIRTEGMKGLTRGGVAVVPRAFVASSSQLLAFTYSKQLLSNYSYFNDRKLLTSFCASMVGGVAISVLTAPFDLILIRIYNQGMGHDGKGKLYSGYFDCVYKVYSTEGLRAFYKGIGPMYMRLGPHSVLTLMFWDIFKDFHRKVSEFM